MTRRQPLRRFGLNLPFCGRTRYTDTQIPTTKLFQHLQNKMLGRADFYFIFVETSNRPLFKGFIQTLRKDHTLLEINWAICWDPKSLKSFWRHAVLDFIKKSALFQGKIRFKFLWGNAWILKAGTYKNQF